MSFRSFIKLVWLPNMPYVICEKRQAVLDADGHCLVLGGPGSGKTTLAMLKAMRRIEVGLRSGQSILFLSFSRAAVARITAAAKSEEAFRNRGLPSIQTFHSFFWQILQGHAYLLGAHRTLSIVPTHEEAALRDGIAMDDAEWPAWEKKRRELFHAEGRVCFDLFAPLAAEVLSRSARLRRRFSERYPLVLVDEAQDTNDEQWECIRLLAELSQIVCLADPDQMIFGHLPGVSAKRLPEIRATLAPLEVSLGTENNRSPGTEIAQFARDVFLGQVRAGDYAGVTVVAYQRKGEHRDNAIRASVGYLTKLIVKSTGERPESIAILASYTKGVAVVSAALQKEKPIPHQVLFDESFALLAARAAAFLLEPRNESQTEDVATLLELLGTAFQAKGNVTARRTRDRCFVYAARVRAGEHPSVKLVIAAAKAIAESADHARCGDPRRDWTAVKETLRTAGDSTLEVAASQLDYLVAFARGRRISEALSTAWMEYGCYQDARAVVDATLSQDQLLSAGEQLEGIQVMNSHKAKGKQFDGVVLYQQEYHSPFAWRNETAPFTESRRLLHMTISRARRHVLVLSEVYPICPILKSDRRR